ncbi:M48 family metallopeptidase [Hoyosella subflava]|uniref:Peptidase M48 Ste24p n=1 Tax=Hoyosella subflava (strain DSM 45089 / JCM 17490 / NBRC 109087 / DQS3-9A1) TaxID=443218 RepID=F6EPN9_HOYSD|nr:M48 family metallopeptidase [Hoyosella subflava]AEF40518.1 Peptidase M48 Ste24p [Hoyosella subflava DQS3-9A1]
MNFFERQKQVRRSSTRLVVLFVVAVLAIVTLANLLVVVASLSGGSDPGEVATFAVLVTIGTLVFIGGVSFVRTMSLRSGGGSKVALALGAVPVPDDTTDPHLRRYRNVVEEIAIASSTPVPDLFVMPGERGINAFAAGYTPADAAVAVTQGALERLNRDELQGVIAHEFSHIINGDMRLNIRLIGVLAGLTALSVIGRVLLYSGGGRQRGNNNAGAPIALIGIVALIAGFIGVFFGRLIKAAVSRQREFLADASAVQFTRQTSGLAGALKKIGGLDDGSKLRNAKTEDVSHMLFGEGMNFSSLFATHPPLVKRIQTLEPEFSPEKLADLQQRWRSNPPSGLREDVQLGLVADHDIPPSHAAGAPRRQAPSPSARSQSPISVDPAAVVAGIGDPSSTSYAHGERIRRDIPSSLADKAHDGTAVVPLVFGLLMSNEHDVRTRQHAIIATKYGREVADASWNTGGEVQQLDPHLRLPLAEIAFPALRHRGSDDVREIMGTLSDLIAADGRVSVFEYCLGTLVFTGLHEVLTHKPRWGGRRHSLSGSRDAVSTLLAVLARVGNDEQAAAEKAFQAGMNVVFPGQQVTFALPDDGILALEHVWPIIDGLAGEEKGRLVESVVTTVMDNGQVTLEEGELIRTVCAVLHCPVPPLA